MIFEARIDRNRFKYIEYLCGDCKAKGVSMDTSMVRCPQCGKTLSNIWEKQKTWEEKN